MEAQKLFSKYVGVNSRITEGEVGSEERQKTEDLNGLFEGNFDTMNAGLKMEGSSYELIARELGKSVGEILFLSDHVKEIQAAKEAGLQALLVDRPSNAPLSKHDVETQTIINTLDEVKFVQ